MNTRRVIQALVTCFFRLYIHSLVSSNLAYLVVLSIVETLEEESLQKGSQSTLASMDSGSGCSARITQIEKDTAFLSPAIIFNAVRAPSVQPKSPQEDACTDVNSAG